MPIWAEANGGPLNYIQIADIIAFIRAPSTQEYTRRTPELNEPIIGADGKVLMFKGWRDTTFKPEPSATAVPDCYKGDGGTASQAPSETLGPDTTILEVATSGEVEFGVHELTAPAGKPFGIHFTNSTGLNHDVDIRLQDGTVVVDNKDIPAGEVTYSIKALEAGTYTFICSIHPIPAMTGTLTVK
jgi:plastocyanin